MTSPAQFRPTTTAPVGVHLVRATGNAAQLGQIAQQMYVLVGGPWHWRDRLAWSDSEWTRAMSVPGVEIWLAVNDVDDRPAGYAELGIEGTEVRIHYFGLSPEFIGRGIGGWLLSRAIERGWQLGASRITLNTCTLDGAAALPNYLARGFAVTRTVHQQREVPDEPR